MGGTVNRPSEIVPMTLNAWMLCIDGNGNNMQWPGPLRNDWLIQNCLCVASALFSRFRGYDGELVELGENVLGSNASSTDKSTSSSI